MGVHQFDLGHRRIGAVDAARGTAMVFVFFSHFVEVYFRRHGLPVDLAYMAAMIASPAFIVISGVMLGVLYCTRKERFGPTKSRFIRRGLFLLTAGRALIYIAHVPFAGGWEEALRWGFMTDTIGVCIILGPLLIERLGRRMRLWGGVLLLGLSWAAIRFWTPSDLGALACKELLFGPFGTALRFFVDVFPILPWFGLYLTATSAGEYLGDLMAAGKERQAVRVIFRIGIAGIVSAVSLFALRFILHRVGTGLPGIAGDMIMSPFQKLPPSPAYFLFYGGCAFILLFLLMHFQGFVVVRHYSVVFGLLGRTSLFVFIVQYFVYFGIFDTIDFGPTVVWPLYFALSGAVIWGLAFLWDRGNMNKYLIFPDLASVTLHSKKP